MSDQLVPVRRQLQLARSIDDSVAAFVNGDHYAVGTATEDFVSVLVHECLAVVRRAQHTVDGIAAPPYWDAMSASTEDTERQAS